MTIYYVKGEAQGQIQREVSHSSAAPLSSTENFNIFQLFFFAHNFTVLVSVKSSDEPLFTTRPATNSRQPNIVGYLSAKKVMHVSKLCNLDFITYWIHLICIRSKKGNLLCPRRV